jgi:type IV pilus assembly protein PilQ
VQAMKNLNSIFFLTLIMVLLSSCTTTEEVKKTGLLDPENFINERQGEIDRTVALGPRITVDTNKEKKIRNNERREINKEERKNYINVSNADQALFSVSINFENVSIQDMAIMFSEVTGRNILVGDEVDGRVSAKLVNVPWDKALDSVLKIKKLAKHVDEKANIIRIHKQDILVAQEEFDRKRIEDLQKTREAQRAIEPIYTEIFRLYYTNAKEVKAEIESVMGAGDSEGDTGGGGSSSNKQVDITIDERLNSLIIQATKTELDLIARLIKEVDVRTKQVLIEAFIVEADDDYTKELGAKFGIDAANLGNLDGDHYGVSTAGVAGTQSDTGGSLKLGATTGLITNYGVPGAGIGFILNTTSSALKLELSASETDGITKILSNPRVFTLDNQEAVINQGLQIPYKVVEDGNVTYEFKEAGVKLTVTPSIVGDGNIILNVKVEKKSEKQVAGADALAINVNEIKTKLLIKDNTIVVIGGVYTQTTKENISKTPFFGDLPIIGNLFKKDTNSDSRKELLIFLAPRVI